MSKPARLCSCGKVIPHGTTCPCQIAAKRARDRRHDARRPNSRQRGYTREWQVKSRQFLEFHPTCWMCAGKAELVDHITPHKGDPVLFWDYLNWQALCTRCHNSRKQRIEARDRKAKGHA